MNASVANPQTTSHSIDDIMAGPGGGGSGSVGGSSSSFSRPPPETVPHSPHNVMPHVQMTQAGIPQLPHMNYQQNNFQR